jgi:hypothetical protein
MMDARFLYVEHLIDLTCPTCGEAVIPASVPHGFSMSHVVGRDGEPARFAELPAGLRLSTRCSAGHTLRFAAPVDARCMLYRAEPEGSSRAVVLDEE